MGSTYLQLLSDKRDVLILSLISVLLIVGETFDMEAIGLTGEVISSITSAKVNQTNWYGTMVCKYVVGCKDGSRFVIIISLCQNLTKSGQNVLS